MTAHRSTIRRAVAVGAAATAAVLLVACGGGNDSSAGRHGGHDGESPASASPSADRGGHNAADVSFAKGMIPHHQQAVEMAGLAESRAMSAEVKKLAAGIEKAQDPEIKTLSGWLASWGEKLPEQNGGGEHAGHSMSGMMASGDMKELEKASGAAFDTAFLRMMVEHHEGAVEMAEAEQSDGVYPPGKDMAESIVTSQSVEITRMNKLLGTA